MNYDDALLLNLVTRHKKKELAKLEKEKQWQQIHRYQENISEIFHELLQKATTTTTTIEPMTTVPTDVHDAFEQFIQLCIIHLQNVDEIHTKRNALSITNTQIEEWRETKKIDDFFFMKPRRQWGRPL